jgi:hypothetical protein
VGLEPVPFASVSALQCKVQGRQIRETPKLCVGFQQGTGPTKNKFQKIDIFLVPKTHHSKTSIPPSIHHNFTSKLPHQKTHICQNPVQKRPQIGQK